MSFWEILAKIESAINSHLVAQVEQHTGCNGVTQHCLIAEDLIDLQSFSKEELIFISSILENLDTEKIEMDINKLHLLLKYFYNVFKGDWNLIAMNLGNFLDASMGKMERDEIFTKNYINAVSIYEETINATEEEVCFLSNNLPDRKVFIIYKDTVYIYYVKNNQQKGDTYV